MPIKSEILAPDTTLTARKILIYGDPGAGKTELIGTIQNSKMGKIAVCSATANGSRTLKKYGNIKNFFTPTLKDVEEVAWLAVKGDAEFAGINTLVVDDLTVLQLRDLNDIAALAAKDPRNAKRVEEGKAARDADVREVTDWMIDQSRMIRILSMLRDLPDMHVVFTCHAKMTYPKKPNTNQQDKTRQPDVVAPDLAMEKVLTAVRAMVDDVWYLYVDKAGNRQLVTSEIGSVKAKTRESEFAAKLGYKTESGSFMPVLANPTFPQIISLYEEAFATK